MQELRAFAKHALQPGEQTAVRLALSPRAFAVWDIELRRFRVHAGDYEIRVGASSRDIRLTGTWRVDSDTVL
jgi:beta-glucosidase